MLIERNCLQCQKTFQANKSDVNRGHAKFCCLSCSSKYSAGKRPKGQPNVECALCKSPFYKTLARLKNSKSELYFCCREHKNQAQRIGGIKEIMPPHYGVSLKSYRDIAFRNLPHVCNRCGFFEYPILQVHHIDRDRKNNDLSNLEILCPNCHEVEHLLKGDGRHTKEN